MSDALKVALVRGVVVSILAGALAALLDLQQGTSLKVALIAGGVQLVYNLIARVGVEGTVDSLNALPKP